MNLEVFLPLLEFRERVLFLDFEDDLDFDFDCDFDNETVLNLSGGVFVFYDDFVLIRFNDLESVCVGSIILLKALVFIGFLVDIIFFVLLRDLLRFLVP